MNTPTTPQTDPLMALLAEADPALGVSVSPFDARHLVVAALDAEKPAKRSSKWWTAAAVGAVAVLGVGAPGAAMAGGYLAQTGWFGSPNPGSPEGTLPIGTEADGSEWVDETAPDYVEYAASVWPEYATLPPTYDVDHFATAIAEEWVAADERQTPGESSLRQVTGIRSEFEQWARCAWQAEWLDADAAGDSARAAIAAETLTSAATWPAIVATDGGGIVEGELAVANAASAGDRGTVESLNSGCQIMLERIDK